MSKYFKIYIDAGHGGSDPGAVANGLREKDVTLQIAKRIETILKNEYAGVATRMSRTGDQTVSLSQRTSAANAWSADVFLSIHVNAGGGTGYEDFIYNGKVGSATIALQNVMHAEITKQVDFRNRGKKRANFQVLRESRMSAILTENGFIDNRSDASKLKQSSYIERIARGHVNGLARALGIKKKPAPKPSAPEPSGKLYRVQVGAFADKKNAERLAAELKKKGYQTYITN